MSARTEPAIGLQSEYYVDESVFALEQQKIFSQNWQLICAIDRLRDQGDFLTFQIAGIGAFLVRGNDGEIRGFRNACRHRGARLLDGEGNCDQIQCPYHGWEYDNKGALIATAWFEKPSPFACEELPLIPVDVTVWRGLIFAALDPQLGLLEQLGDFEKEVEDIPIETFRTAEWQSFEGTGVNWKTYFDQFTENYHVPLVHAPDKSLEIWNYTADAYDGIVVLRAPADGMYFGGRWIWGWPNWTLSTFPGGIKLSRVEPVSASKFVIHFQYLFADMTDDGTGTRRPVIDATETIFRDDIAACRLAQINYDAGNYIAGPLHPDLERGVAYFQSRVRGALGPITV